MVNTSDKESNISILSNIAEDRKKNSEKSSILLKYMGSTDRIKGIY